MRENNKIGISIVTLASGNDSHLDRVLSAFIKINTYYPVEWIIFSHDSTGLIDKVIARYVDKMFIRHIVLSKNYSFVDKYASER